MVRKMLIATDGSVISQKTACAGVAFAGQLGAEVLALFVAPAYQYPIYVEIVPPTYPDEEEYCAQMLRKGEEIMASIMHAAAQAGVKHACRTAFSDAAALEIVEIAERESCDLIFMGSHGRSGWGQVLLGSVTNKVLSHTTKPVLVHRLLQQPAS